MATERRKSKGNSIWMEQLNAGIDLICQRELGCRYVPFVAGPDTVRVGMDYRLKTKDDEMDAIERGAKKGYKEFVHVSGDIPLEGGLRHVQRYRVKEDQMTTTSENPHAAGFPARLATAVAGAVANEIARGLTAVPPIVAGDFDIEVKTTAAGYRLTVTCTGKQARDCE